MKKLILLLICYSMLHALQKPLVDNASTELCNFKLLATYVAHSFHTIQCYKSVQDKLKALTIIDQHVQQQAPSLVGKIYKQALLLLRSVHCEDPALIDDLWYAHTSEVAFHLRDAISDVPLYPPARKSLKINNEVVDQNELYKPSKEQQRHIEQIMIYGNQLCHIDTQSSFNDSELRIIETYCAIAPEHLNKLNYLLKKAFFNGYPQAHHSSSQERQQLFDTFLNTYPVMKDLLGIIRSQASRFQNFLWRYNGTYRYSHDVFSSTQEMINSIHHPLFVCLSNALQRVLTIHLYRSKVRLHDELYDEKKEQKCYTAIKKFYTNPDMRASITLDKIIESQLQGLSLYQICSFFKSTK